MEIAHLHGLLFCLSDLYILHTHFMNLSLTFCVPKHFDGVIASRCFPSRSLVMATACHSLGKGTSVVTEPRALQGIDRQILVFSCVPLRIPS